MPRIVILGSCEHEPYEVLIAPNKLDSELYEKDHEKAYEEATKKFFPAIDEADEVWVYAPDGMGIHTTLDYTYALQQGKTIRFLAIAPYLSDTFMEKMFRKFYNQSIAVKQRLESLVQSLATTARNKDE